MSYQENPVRVVIFVSIIQKVGDIVDKYYWWDNDWGFPMYMSNNRYEND